MQETWLDDESDISYIQIDGYTLICQGKTCSSHAGLAIYLSNKCRQKTLNVDDNPNIWERQFLEITCYGFFAKITLPTRLSNDHGTLMDNLLCKLSKEFFKSSAGILRSNITDRFPYFISFDYVQTVNNISTYMQIKQHSPE